MRKKLIEARKSFGYSQAKVAELIGLTTLWIGNIERSQSNPSLLVAFKLSELYKVNIDPANKIHQAFEHLMYLPAKEIYHIAKTLEIPFDPDGLFKEE